MSLFGPNPDFRQVSDSYIEVIDRLVTAAGQFDGEGVAEWLSELDDDMEATAAVLCGMLALAPGQSNAPDLTSDELTEFSDLLAENWVGAPAVADATPVPAEPVAGDPSKPYDWESEPDELSVLAAASVPPFDVWSELLLAILRDTTGPSNGWSRDSLVSAHQWSLHAALIVGFLSADWLVTDRWRLLWESVDSVSVDGGGPSFKHSWEPSGD